MADLKGKVGIVTGGGTGIGRATALAMARAGASLVIGNRDAAKGEEVVRLIVQGGGRAVFQKTDVSKPDDVKALVGRAVSEFGRLDLAFNNAGMDGEQVPLHEQDIEQGDDALRRERQGRLLLHEVRDRADAQDRRRGDREHVLDLRAERLPRLERCTRPPSTPSPG